jgi:hypothetical protein
MLRIGYPPLSLRFKDNAGDCRSSKTHRARPHFCGRPSLTEHNGTRDFDAQNTVNPRVWKKIALGKIIHRGNITGEEKIARHPSLDLLGERCARPISGHDPDAATASRSSRQASSSRAPKPNASSASMEYLGTTRLRMVNHRRKPARVRSASPAHRPVTTGMPSLAPSHGGFTMKACLRARANWFATCLSGSPRRVGFRMRAQSAGVCRHCGRC